MEFKYSTASDYAITVRNASYADIAEWISTGEFSRDLSWITFPLSKVAYAVGITEPGVDGKPKRFARFVLDCEETVYIVEDENIKKILAKTMWKNIFGPEEGEEEETNEED